eukprot:scaffold97416_cov22-Tisochrysis_lutea.AAC.1
MRERAAQHHCCQLLCALADVPHAAVVGVFPRAFEPHSSALPAALPPLLRRLSRQYRHLRPRGAATPTQESQRSEKIFASWPPQPGYKAPVRGDH